MSTEEFEVVCGDANQGGNIEITYKGGCRKKINIKDAYRCVGCGGWFHLDCIIKHFQLEECHDNARRALAIIRKSTRSAVIRRLCEEGIKPTVQTKKKGF